MTNRLGKRNNTTLSITRSLFAKYSALYFPINRIGAQMPSSMVKQWTKKNG